MSTKPSLRFAIYILLGFALTASAQQAKRDFDIPSGGTVEVINHFGRVDVSVEAENPDDPIAAGDEKKTAKVSMSANSSVAESEIKIDKSGGKLRIEAVPGNSKKRIDISLIVPSRTRLKVETLEGEVRVSGNLELIEVMTNTGTIAADVPTVDLKYGLYWTASRPRFLSDFELEKVKEKAGGKFEITGRYPKAEGKSKKEKVKSEGADGSEPPASAGGLIADTETPPGSAEPKKKPKPKDQKPKTITLNFTTARGIILLNVPPNEVSSDLRERPLTVAAKAIVRSGDSLLMDAIRRASPKYFGDYARTLPPLKLEPSFAERQGVQEIPVAGVKRAVVRVTDLNNRAIADLQPADFEVVENNIKREILSVRPVTAPFNLVLLLDVSGSVDNFVTFIRKAARNFVETVDQRDRISIVIFNDDVKVVSRFTTDKSKLSESLDTFDAGGSTAYYDALAYTLAETLRPLKGERTAIVILTDGDDNRSFLPFDSLLGSIQESGSLIYPLYVPSGLIAVAAANDPGAAIDPLRKRYMSSDLTSKAQAEGEKLAKVSGGVYYPITQISQIQKAYDDIVVQLRTAYTVTFRSETAAAKGNGASPRLKVRVNKNNAFVSIGPVVQVSESK